MAGLQCCADMTTERARTHLTASSSSAKLCGLPRRQAARLCTSRAQPVVRCAFAVPVMPSPTAVTTAASSAVNALRGAANNISVAPPKQTVLTDQPSPVLRVRPCVRPVVELASLLSCTHHNTFWLQKVLGLKPLPSLSEPYMASATALRSATQFCGVRSFV